MSYNPVMPKLSLELSTLYIYSGSLRIPSHIRVLHVEQEVVGDDTLAVDSVLESDTKRASLLAEEKQLNTVLNAGYETSRPPPSVRN